MSYCRLSNDSDAYVYKDISDRANEVRCCACSLLYIALPKGGFFDGRPNFIAEGPLEMVDHLKEHIAMGHKIPPRALTWLRRDARTVKPVKYPVHALRPHQHLGNVPLCGFNFSAHFRKILPSLPQGHAHPRDETTRDLKQVTCKQCKKLLKAGPEKKKTSGRR